MNKDGNLKLIYAQLIDLQIKNIKIDKLDFNYILSNYTKLVDQKFSQQTLRRNGAFLTSMSIILLKMMQKLMNDLSVFHKTKFLQINFDALSTKDKPVRKRRTFKKKEKIVEVDPEELSRQKANQHFIKYHLSQPYQIPSIQYIAPNQKDMKKIPQKLALDEMIFTEHEQPVLNLIEQSQQQQQSKIEKQDSMEVEEQPNNDAVLEVDNYKKVNGEKKKKKKHDYILDKISTKVVNKFIEDEQENDRMIQNQIKLGVMRLQQQEMISILLKMQPKVRIYSHLLPSKVELKQYEQGNRPIQELRAQNSIASQEQQQEIGFLDDKPPSKQEISQHIQQMPPQVYSQQLEIELSKNFTYSFEHSGLLFNSFADRQDKSLKFYLLMCQCQKSKNFRIEQTNVLQFGPIRLIKKY